MRDQLAAAERRAPSQESLDSLRRAVATAESQAASLDAKMRAIRGTDFAGMAQQNQGAVGLITVALGGDRYDGTGFVISADGYMLTNWHVVADSAHAEADTVWVTMADQSLGRYADVIATARERDVALIKIRGYQGSYLSAIDWGGTKARQGEPAALIGYPAGSGFARGRASVVRTSMTAGILSRVTPDLIQFDGMTTGAAACVRVSIWVTCRTIESASNPCRVSTTVAVACTVPRAWASAARGKLIARRATVATLIALPIVHRIACSV